MLANKASIFFSLLCATTVAGCNTNQQRKEPPSETTSAASQQQVTPLTSEPGANRKGPCGEGTCEKRAGEHHDDCPSADGPGAPGADTVRTGKDPKTGKTMSMVGQALTDAPVVTVKQLLEKPDDYAGKNVRIEGNVTAMCHHRRVWFTVQDPGDRTGSNVRVTAWPAFLTPSDAMGKQVRVEGAVMITQTSPTFARHLADSHQVGQPPTDDQAVKTVTLRASGAEFY